MGDLKNRLMPFIDIPVRKLKQSDTLLYNELVTYANTINYLPGEVLRVFKTHRCFSAVAQCIACGTNFNPYIRKGNTCTKSCQSLYMHKTRSPETVIAHRNNVKLTNDKKRESGELSAISQKAFETRRKNYSIDELSDQYKRICISTNETKNRKKSEKRAKTIHRITVILTRKSPLLLLRLFYVNGGAKTYGNLINEFVKLGFTEFNEFKSSKFRYATRNGLSFLSKCIECGGLCSFRNRFCSYACKDSNFEQIKNISEKLKGWNAIPENKEKMILLLIERHAKKTPEERHLIAKKIYNGKSQEWINSKSQKALDTRIARGQILSKNIEVRSEYDEYKSIVSKLTNSNKFYIDGIEFRGKHTFHIDHIYPIVKGFINNIPPELIGSILNLQMLPAAENIRKNSKIIIIPEHIKEYLNADDNKGTI